MDIAPKFGVVAVDGAAVAGVVLRAGEELLDERAPDIIGILLPDSTTGVRKPAP